MATILLYCAEPEGLKLGPGAAPGEYITFHQGFARFKESDFPDWEAWVRHPGSPTIEILPPDSAQVPVGTVDAIECQVCGKAFTTKLALTGHLRSHAPKG